MSSSDILALALWVLVAGMLFVTDGAAHEWYDRECCSDRDCAPLPDGSVKATDQGWLITTTGETIPYGDTRERVSQDHQFHRCVRFYPPGTRCLYVPGAGM